MTRTSVAIFTDNDFEKVNGVTTALSAVLDHAPDDVDVRVYTSGAEKGDGHPALPISKEADARAQARIDVARTLEGLPELAPQALQVSAARRGGAHAGRVHVQQCGAPGQTPRDVVAAGAVLRVPVVAEVDDAQAVAVQVRRFDAHVDAAAAGRAAKVTEVQHNCSGG